MWFVPPTTAASEQRGVEEDGADLLKPYSSSPSCESGPMTSGLGSYQHSALFAPVKLYRPVERNLWYHEGVLLSLSAAYAYTNTVEKGLNSEENNKHYKVILPKRMRYVAVMDSQ